MEKTTDCSRRTLGTLIRREARALGFDLVGIAPAGEAADAPHLTDWLANGFHGDMAYLEKRVAERQDPRRLVPGAKSVVVVAMSYATRESGQPVARYAHGRDYHNVMKRRLRKLRRAIRRAEPGARIYSAADTGPVLERYWAQQAGLGWIGRATNLVTRSHSSWVLLGTVIFDREVDYDRASPDHCGSCTRCISACPTRAIVAPGVVDARLCISYLTIESRGGIPRELRAHVGGRLFGCDDCQEVCPWGKFAPDTPNEALAPRISLTAIDAARFLDMDEATFDRVFEGSPIRRARLAGMKRNALVVLGNSGNRRHVARLARVLVDDPSPLLRGHAAWALGQLGARESLSARREIEVDESVLDEIDAAIGSAAA